MGMREKLSSLWTSEDWWAVWFGAVIIIVAILGFLGKAPKLGEWTVQPMAEFYSYERSVALERAPESLVISGTLKKRLNYDREKKLLSYKGLMTVAQRDELKRLSSDAAYMEAIDRLYETPPVPTGNIFVKLLILYVTLGGLTAIGIRAMGEDPYRYMGAFAVVLVLAIASGMLKLLKEVDLGQARPGDTVTYTIVFSNPGIEGVREIEITDPVSEAVELVTDGFGPGQDIAWISGSGTVYLTADPADADEAMYDSSEKLLRIVLSRQSPFTLESGEKGRIIYMVRIR